MENVGVEININIDIQNIEYPLLELKMREERETEMGKKERGNL